MINDMYFCFFSFHFIVLFFHFYVVFKKKSIVGNFDAQEEKIGNSSDKEIL